MPKGINTVHSVKKAHRDPVVAPFYCQISWQGESDQTLGINEPVVSLYASY
jgi:hypothetical protein